MSAYAVKLGGAAARLARTGLTERGCVTARRRRTPRMAALVTADLEKIVQHLVADRRLELDLDLDHPRRDVDVVRRLPTAEHLRAQGSVRDDVHATRSNLETGTPAQATVTSHHSRDAAGGANNSPGHADEALRRSHASAPTISSVSSTRGAHCLGMRGV
ncbi:MAG: hypothetical protein Q8Q14_01385 [Gemmatimonadales bacterium]|nr:hypothetical protein [Gemmatimonadales bacterium]